MSEFDKLNAMLDVYEKVLHPDFFMVFRKQLQACYEENKRQAYVDAKISDTALKLEEILKRLRVNLGIHRDHPRVCSWHKKIFFKELLKMV